MQILAHGGAGSAPDEPESRQAVLDTAVEQAADADTPLDAVERVITHLESDPKFNAGVGGAIQSDGVSRTDAGLMTGAGGVGAAASMPGVEHAIRVARVVLEETPHVMLMGSHAVELARDYSIETGQDLRSESARKRWDEAPAPPADGSYQQAP